MVFFVNKHQHYSKPLHRDLSVKRRNHIYVKMEQKDWCLESHKLTTKK